MAEMPENLQVIKTERLTPERSPSTNLIKERLNLHVKRRLQQEHQLEHQIQLNVLPGAAYKATTPQPPSHDGSSIASASTVKRKTKQQKEPTAKTRRPYQKRADKNSSKTQTSATTDNGGVRKNKSHKAKQAMAVGMAESTATNVGSAVPSVSGVASAEEGSCDGQEMEGREVATREKEKCPDILGMVLSLKKRALMQDAEVQAFLAKVMNAFKN